jgi:hypothetical protein
MADQTIHLNGFHVELSSATFVARKRPLPAGGSLRELREEFPEWTLHRRRNEVFGVPHALLDTNDSGSDFGEEIELRCEQQLGFVSKLVEDALPERLSSYQPIRLRPFTFLAQQQELVAAALKAARIPSSALLEQFEQRPRFSLAPRFIETRDGAPFIGLFVEISTRKLIEARLEDLIEAGVDISGLDVIWRTRPARGPVLVGRIADVRSGEVHLSDALGDVERVTSDEVKLEGAPAAFARCFKSLLGGRYESFESARQSQEDAVLNGPAREASMATMQGFLKRRSPFALAPGLECTIGERIVVANDRDYRSVVVVPNVEYCFDPAKSKRAQLPFKGIETHGPYSRDTFAKRSPRIAVIFPDTIQGPVEHFLRQFRDGITSVKWGRLAFSGGFAKTFGLVNPEFLLVPVPWLKREPGTPAQAYRRTIEEFLSREQAIDAAIVVLLDEHEHLPDLDSPYLNSKALLLMNGVPSQEIRQSKIQQRPEDLQYILQDVSIALYAKMNGVPWTVNHDLTISDEIVIGIGTAELLPGGRYRPRQRFVGITTVFRGDGNYLLGNVSKECEFEEYPEALRAAILDVLRDVKIRNGWQAGDTIRIVCHSFKPLRRVEIDTIVAECVKEVGSEQTVQFAFLTVEEDHPFALTDIGQPGIPQRSGGIKGAYAPQRGTIVQTGRYNRLLAVNGPALVKRADASLPRPLQIRLHAQSSFRDQTYLAEQVLKFTSLSWRSTRPAGRPVTIHYSELIARLLARFRSLPDWSPAVLNTKLRASRWFL